MSIIVILVRVDKKMPFTAMNVVKNVAKMALERSSVVADVFSTLASGLCTASLVHHPASGLC